MQIKLSKLSLRNFKGIKKFDFEPECKNASVIADNGRGKTTLFDSFLWLIFDKDSNDRTTFKIKPQDENGNDIHNLQSTVEAELLIDDELLKLKKMQEEKWTKKRGAEQKELTGNTVSYWWDEEPVKATEYKKRISDLIDENVFKMITNPLYFNTMVKWQDRRNMLLEICGDATEEEVIQSDKSLAKLLNILNGKSIDAYKKILADKLKGLEKERANIPPRIDELTLTLPDIEADYSDIETELQNDKDMLIGIEADMSNANSIVNEFRKKQQQLYGLKGKLEKVKSKINSKANSGRKKLLEEKAELVEGKFTLESSVKLLERTIYEDEELIKSNTVKRQQLVEEWKSLKAEKAACFTEEFTEPNENDFICPTCGQDLPTENKASQIANMRNAFEETKKTKLKNLENELSLNKSKGLKVKNSTEAAQKTIDESKAELEEKRESLLKIINQVRGIDAELDKPAEEPDYLQNTEYTSLQQQINNLQAELDKPIEDTTAELSQQKQEIQSKIDSLNAILNSKETIEKNKKRIEELKADEKRIAGLITELEGHKYLLERFTVAKVNLLEDKINSRFSSVRFKMFEENITNDGIKECCEALVNTNGSYVPFADANHAGQINAGIDCINALGSYYDIIAPIFIDNKESVSTIIDTQSQLIKLIKPPTWDELDKDTQKTLAGVEGDEYSTENWMKIEKAKKVWSDRNKTLRVEVEE